MSLTTRENTISNAIVNAVIQRFPSLAWDYDRTQAAPLATPPASIKHRKMCSIERAIRARDLSATVAALA